VRELTVPERLAVTSQAAKAAEMFLKNLQEPESTPGVVEARATLERFRAEFEAATSEVETCKTGVTDARGRLQTDVTAGRSGTKAWAAVTAAERALVEATLRVETVRHARGEAEAKLTGARVTAMQSAMPAAREAVSAAIAAARASEVAFLTGERTLALVRSRAGALACRLDHLTSPAAAAGGLL
jgi:hypothetical protein